MTFDSVICGAQIHDGTGREGYAGDVAIHGGKIAEIGQLDGAETAQRIDGRGLALCPGFIDAHSHADTVIHRGHHQRLLEPLLRQGITTVVGGNCGMAMAPVSGRFRGQALSYLDAFLGEDQEPYIGWETMGGMMETLDHRGTVLNCGLLAPHGMIRIAAKGLERGLATPDELRAMKVMLADCLEAGALGMSAGLQYFPGLSADEEELVQLAELLTPVDGVLSTHLRSYSNTLPEAIDELMTVSRRTGARVQLSHLFVIPHVNGLVDKAFYAATRLGAAIYKRLKIPVPVDQFMRSKLAHINREIEAGMPMGVDAMPTGAGFTHAFAFFPPWALEGGKERIIERLSDRATRARIGDSITHGKSVWPHREADTWSMNFFQLMGFRSVYVMAVQSDQNQRYVGKNFVEIGKERGVSPFDAVCDMLLEEDGRLLVFETPSWPGDEFVERSVYAGITDPNVSIVTDSILLGTGKPSHLFYDCYPRLLGKYVRREKVLPLPEAIRKSTSLPAQQLGIKGRGVIEPGNWADLVLFDPDTVDTRSTPLEPDVFPTGIDTVMVNGHPVVTPDGYHPDPRPGQVVRRGEA